MSEYVVDFGDKSSAFVGLAMAEAESHGATLKERVVRCMDCCCFHRLHEDGTGVCVRHGHGAAPNGFCVWGCRKQ